MTTRRWMLLVALCAVGAAGLLHMERLNEEYLSHSLECSRLEVDMMMKKAFLESLLKIQGPKMTTEERAYFERGLRKASEKIGYYDRMQAKYRRAALYPWLGVD